MAYSTVSKKRTALLELDEVERVVDVDRPGEVDDKGDAGLQRADEQRLPVAVVAGDLRPEGGHPRAELCRVEVDLADSLVEDQEAWRRP